MQYLRLACGTENGQRGKTLSTAFYKRHCGKYNPTPPGRMAYVKAMKHRRCSRGIEAQNFWFLGPTDEVIVLPAEPRRKPEPILATKLRTLECRVWVDRNGCTADLVWEMLSVRVGKSL